jgi:hypothetical protein
MLATSTFGLQIINGHRKIEGRRLQTTACITSVASRRNKYLRALLILRLSDKSVSSAEVM